MAPTVSFSSRSNEDIKPTNSTVAERGRESFPGQNQVSLINENDDAKKGNK